MSNLNRLDNLQVSSHSMKGHYSSTELTGQFSCISNSVYHRSALQITNMEESFCFYFQAHHTISKNKVAWHKLAQFSHPNIHDIDKYKELRDLHTSARTQLSSFQSIQLTETFMKIYKYVFLTVTRNSDSNSKIEEKKKNEKKILLHF